MPSIRKKFAGFIRQFSNPSNSDYFSPNAPKSPGADNTGCFIQRYLNGETRLKQPEIFNGRTGQELPSFQFHRLENQVIAACTGPDEGLTSVNQGKKSHLMAKDADVSFIDSEDESNTPTPQAVHNPIGNGMMTIRAMGKTFTVRNDLVQSSVTISKSNIKESNCNETGVVSSESVSPSPPLSSPSLSPSAVTCADQSDYEDFLSKLGILSLSLNPCDGRHSITKVDSPDDTLVSGSTSLATSELASPMEDSADSVPELSPCIPEIPIKDDSVLNNIQESSFDILVTNRDSKAAAESTVESIPSTQGDVEEEQEDAPKENDTGSNQEDYEKEIAGVSNWNCSSGVAYGIATSLYERHPIGGETAGNPLADAFGIVVRSNSAIMALADGVNWGEKAALAARSAVHGCIDYLNRALFGTFQTGKTFTTTEVFLSLLRSFHAAHGLILQEGGLLTTLTAAVVAELDKAATPALSDEINNSTRKFAVCVCNVGDSLAYVYSSKYGVREITQGSHDIHSMRDMRDALGALGPVDGQNPELNNLTCSMTIIEEDDIVFLTSDGISDNFDPVVGKFVVARKPEKLVANPTDNKQTVTKDFGLSLPTVEAFQRHELTLLRMEDILRNGLMPTGAKSNLKAQQLCEDLIDFATRLTAAKRRLLEDVDLYVDHDGVPLDKEEQRMRRRKICERLALIPGKLDHATVVAYQAGIHKAPPDNKDHKKHNSGFEHKHPLSFLESVV